MSRIVRVNKDASEMLLKIIVIGDSGVGKSNMLMRFCEEDFKPNYTPTIGVDFKIKKIQLDNHKLKFQIWDTAGQQRYRTITQTYYKGAHGVLLVFSVTDRRSFQNIENWIKQIQEHGCLNVKSVLVANKIDLKDEREVSESQGKILAQKYSMPYFQTSAKENIKINEAFEQLGTEIIQDMNVNKERYKSAKLESTEQLKPMALQKNKIHKGCSC